MKNKKINIENSSPNLLGLLKRLLLSASLVMIALPVTGCSGLKVAYSLAEGIVQERAKAYLDLSSEQNTRLVEQSSALINWHRESMLPKYAAFFLAQADIAEDFGWSRREVSNAIGTIRLLIDETVKGASGFLAAVLIEQTTPEKISYFAARMDENLIASRKKIASRTSDYLISRRVDRIARFTGPLERRQVSIIRAYTQQDLGSGNRWLDNREQRQVALLTFLGNKPTKEELANFIYKLLVSSHEIVDPAYRHVSEARWKKREAMYFDILRSINVKQRNVLISTLRRFASDMTELSGI